MNFLLTKNSMTASPLVSWSKVFWSSFYLVLAQVCNPPGLLLGILCRSPTVRDQYVLHSHSRSSRVPSVFHAPEVVVWPCRPAEAACYSKWLWVTVVSVWPGIRNTIRLETDGQREGWGHLENKHRTAYWRLNPPVSQASVSHTEGFSLQVYFSFFTKMKSKQGWL